MLRSDGFVFDMGPSWYWMPDVFEDLYRVFGRSASDIYQLQRLSPSFRVFLGKDDLLDIPSEEEDLCSPLTLLRSDDLSRRKWKYLPGTGFDVPIFAYTNIFEQEWNMQQVKAM